MWFFPYSADGAGCDRSQAAALYLSERAHANRLFRSVVSPSPAGPAPARGAPAAEELLGTLLLKLGRLVVCLIKPTHLLGFPLRGTGEVEGARANP